MAALVDYSSDSDSNSNPNSQSEAPPRKKSKPSPQPRQSALPPLPPAFHDLYAHNIRTTPSDNPALHQGRHRQTPHVAGNWPSHISIEWIPTPAEHNLLSSLLAALHAPHPITPSPSSLTSPAKRPVVTAQKLSQKLDIADDKPPIHSLLTSSLGAPLPLHISLSRPFVLPTAGRESFLDDARQALARSVRAFTARAYALAWHQSPDSERAFLVLRVRAEDVPGRDEPLGELLRRCNALVRGVGQPELYAGVGDDIVGAFHVSIAWAAGGYELHRDEVMVRERDGIASRVWGEFGERVGAIGIDVKSVKCKIGNVVTDLPLTGASGTRKAGGGLFG